MENVSVTDLKGRRAVSPGGGSGLANTQVYAAMAAFQDHSPVVLIGDPDRSSDSVVICSARHIETQQLAFMVRHTSGFVQVALRAEDADRVDLPAIGEAKLGEPQACVSVDASEGIGTGISAADRARTIRLLADPKSTSQSFTRPGHVVPVRGRRTPDGRWRPEDAMLDLASRVGVLAVAYASVVSPVRPVDMATPAEALAFAKRHGLPAISVTEVQLSRQGMASALQRSEESRLPLPGGIVRAVAYRSIDSREHLVLLKGDPSRANKFISVHHECIAGDVFGSVSCSCERDLRKSLDLLASAQDGIIVYLRRLERQVHDSVGVFLGRCDNTHRGSDAAAQEDDILGAILDDQNIEQQAALASA